MKHPLSFAFAVMLLPAIAMAATFTYTDATSIYTDSPFARTEMAGISVLTQARAVSGNPDGTFAPERTLNRAEFLKIAVRIAPAGRVPEVELPEDGSIQPTDTWCFSDVYAGDWFGPYVCAAKESGVVGGYPDGTFHPGRAVNYAEALKILSKIFEYDAGEGIGEQWYAGYAEAAKEHGTALPIALAYDAPLTRGQMARLAAAFYTESIGELDLYRQFERGKNPLRTAGSSSSTSSKAATGSSLSSAPSAGAAISTSSQSSVSSVSSILAVSRFAVAGETSHVLYDGLFTNGAEDGVIYRGDIELVREVKSFSSLVLVDDAGTEILTFTLELNDNDAHTKWKAGVVSGSYILPKNTPVRLGIKANMKPVGSALSEEMIDIKTLILRARGSATGAANELAGTDTHFPQHQTSFGRMSGLHDSLGSALISQQGTKRTLGSFTVEGKAAEGSILTVDTLTFTLRATDVTVANPRIGGPNAAQQTDCFIQSGAGQAILICTVPESMRRVSEGPVSMGIYADLALAGTAQAGTVQLVSLGTGKIGTSGTIHWRDQAGSFNWVDPDVVVEGGPVVTVTK